MELSLNEQIERVSEAVYRMTEDAMMRPGYCIAVYPAYTIVEWREQYWRIGYTMDEAGAVSLAERGTWQEVQRQWVAKRFGQPKALIALGEPAMKTWTKDGMGYVEALGVRYGNPDELDLDSDYFDADTDYGPRSGDGMAATLNHRMPLRTRNTNKKEAQFLAELAKHPFKNPVAASKNDMGILVQHVLDLADDYEKTVFALAEQGKFRWSSGSAPHMVEREDDGKIKMWHILEWAYTPTPAEPRLPTITPLKSWANATIDLQALTPQAAGDAATRSATANEAKACDTSKAKKLSLELELLALLTE